MKHINALFIVFVEFMCLKIYKVCGEIRRYYGNILEEEALNNGL